MNSKRDYSDMKDNKWNTMKKIVFWVIILGTACIAGAFGKVIGEYTTKLFF